MDRLFMKNLKDAEKGVYFTPACSERWIGTALGESKKFKSYKKRGTEYRLLNVPSAFDTETTTISEEEGTMYVWMWGLNGTVMVGRTWEEFEYVCRKLETRLHLDGETLLPVYVHNLGFDFQFMRKHLDIDELFAMEELKPMYAIANKAFKFMCSYILTGKGLAECGKSLTTYKVSKKIGDLDYSLPRHSQTPLTAQEIGYCINDVLVVMALIRECMEQEGDITRIPLTKTGYARRKCRNACLYPKNDMKSHFQYVRMMEGLRLKPDEYIMSKRAFAGGFTHANAWYVGMTLHDVTSYDFTSSYPAVMVCKKYPMSAGHFVDTSKWGKNSEKELNKLCSRLNVIMDIELKDVDETFVFDHYISASRCQQVDDPLVDNGRIVSAKRIRLTCTELDYDIIKKTYSWSKLKVHRLYYYYPNYLPKSYIETVLSLYQDKTKLKGVEGKESEYALLKELVNSLYGMMVTDICKDDIVYENNEWHKIKGDSFNSIEEYAQSRIEKIDDYNTSESRFLSYLWGVYVAGHARHNLWEGIMECGDDYKYADTDSIKITNVDKHIDWINNYNERVTEEMKAVCKHYDIDFEMTRPKTIYGEEKPLGVWDFDGHYKTFKTLGAKRYLVEDDSGALKITVAGVNKHDAILYLKEKYGASEAVFNAFKNDLTIPGTNDLGRPIKRPDGTLVDCPSGKLVHRYIHDETSGTLTDYLGNTAEWHELSSVTLTPTSYTLGLSGDFESFLLGLQETDV